MHMHVYDRRVRTTIELTDEQRARLLRLAALRGEKGFSRLVQEAVDAYLDAQQGRADAIRHALTLRGSLDEDEGAELEARRVDLRESWR